MLIMLKLLKYSYIPIIISFIILYLCCFIPTNDIPDIEIELFIPIDKVVHFCMYLGLSGATAINYIYLKKGKVDVTKMLLGAFLLPMLYGGFIELLQNYYFPPRSGDWFDFLADILGSLAALPIALEFKKYILRRETV